MFDVDTSSAPVQSALSNVHISADFWNEHTSSNMPCTFGMQGMLMPQMLMAGIQSHATLTCA